MQTLFAEALLSVYVLAAVRILIQFRNCRQDAGGSQGAMINSSGPELSSPRCSCDVLRHYFRPSCHWTGKSGLDVLLSSITRILICSHSTISTNAMHQTVTRISWRNGSAKTYRRHSRSHRKIASEQRRRVPNRTCVHKLPILSSSVTLPLQRQVTAKSDITYSEVVCENARNLARK
jgi:hypothetical protein